jgi:ribosome-binding protein aMBF1 (putative translation factor)
MATFVREFDGRAVVRCDRCELVQFDTRTGRCRRCQASLYEALQEPPGSAVPPARSFTVSSTSAVGFIVRLLRQAHGMTQSELAERLGVHRNWVNLVERRRCQVRLESVSRLSEALETPASVLLDLAVLAGRAPAAEMKP